ncbi:hypothetical protein [Kutzneria buriramensis]|uniref:Uncharacterized protein n=1 Tax=Kutzneria buriramensis TaxID=1045776 RepID=A0A3E0HC30_9PSEU|nr:hypothetical protein BCF44_111300 [Kutzneria buriramensis]
MGEQKCPASFARSFRRRRPGPRDRTLPAAQAAPAASELQVVGAGVESGMGHTVRHADGTWDPFGQADAAADRTNAGPVTIANGST